MTDDSHDEWRSLNHGYDQPCLYVNINIQYGGDKAVKDWEAKFINLLKFKGFPHIPRGWSQ